MKLRIDREKVEDVAFWLFGFVFGVLIWLAGLCALALVYLLVSGNPTFPLPFTSGKIVFGLYLLISVGALAEMIRRYRRSWRHGDPDSR